MKRKQTIFQACALALALNSAVVGAEEPKAPAVAVTPAAECSPVVIDELIRRKVLDKEGVANMSGIKSPSGGTFIVDGVANVAKGAMGAAAGSFFLGAFMPASVRLSEIDHLVLMMDKSSATSPQDAIEKMRLDTAEVLRDVMGATEVLIDDSKKRQFEYALTGGANCHPAKCNAGILYFAGKENLALQDKSGGYFFSTTISVYKGQRLFLQGNTERITALSRGLAKRGYQSGYWDAQNRLIYDQSGAPCQVAAPIPEKTSQPEN